MGLRRLKASSIILEHIQWPNRKVSLMKMCSTSPKGNCIREVNRILEASSLVTCAISSTSSCCGKDLKEEEEVKSIIQEEDDISPSNYLDKNIFGLLISALEETLIEAFEQNVLWVQKCRFNGLDYIAEFLWNRNPRRPKIYTPPLNVFDIPLFKEYLRSHPRPYYPKSWLWSEDEAALHIQKYVRGWLVRKRANVQEMRKFWKDIAVKSLFGKKEIYSVQFQRPLGNKQDDTKHEIIDEDFIRCEKYRSSTVHTYNPMRILNEKRMF